VDFNNLDVLGVALIVICVVVGFSSSVYAVSNTNDQGAWIQANDSTVKFTFLEATIHVVIKNNNDHAEFFKISQTYSGEGTVSPGIDWNVISTDPPAIKMINSINPGGDLGWEVDSGQTRAVTFTMVETSPPPPFFIQMGAATPNQFWPVIPDQGLTSTWFLPNEIDYLNPNLQLLLWQGHFFFFLKNTQSTGPRVEGNVRAPIVPINSFLIASNPTVDWISTESPSAQTAAWDVTLFPGQQKSYSYTYQWPTGTTVTPANTQSASSRINSGALSDPSDPNSTSDPLSVPTKSTGVPFGLLLVGAIVVVSGIVYARFLR